MASDHNELQTVTPYFTVEDAELLVTFMIAAFGASLTKENRYDDNRIKHARLRLGNSIIMLNQATEEYSANTSQMHLFVEDVDVAYEAALCAGATSLMVPNIRPHGDMMAGVQDPCGNIWWVASARG